MAAFISTDCYRRAARALFLVVPFVVAGALFTSCDQNTAQPRQVDGLKADLEEARRRITHIQNSLAAKDAELAVNIQALETAKNGLTELEKTLGERAAQLSAAQTELDALKKKDALVFAEIAATQGQGSIGLAVARYQKFIKDYPKSPLVLHANNAIAQLNSIQDDTPPATTPVAARAPAKADVPKSTKEFAKSFDEGYMTLQQLAPFLKNKTLAQVIALCGRPNQSYNEGTEIGYADRAINPATGGRGMLIVSFESGTVSTLRVEYGGRKMTP